MLAHCEEGPFKAQKLSCEKQSISIFIANISLAQKNPEHCPLNLAHMHGTFVRVGQGSRSWLALDAWDFRSSYQICLIAQVTKEEIAQPRLHLPQKGPAYSLLSTTFSHYKLVRTPRQKSLVLAAVAVKVP